MILSPCVLEGGIADKFSVPLSDAAAYVLKAATGHSRLMLAYGRNSVEKKTNGNIP